MRSWLRAKMFTQKTRRDFFVGGSTKSKYAPMGVSAQIGTDKLSKNDL
jgi:hypothetical protein